MLTIDKTCERLAFTFPKYRHLGAFSLNRSEVVQDFAPVARRGRRAVYCSDRPLAGLGKVVTDSGVLFFCRH